MKDRRKHTNKTSLKNIQQLFFRTHLLLILTLSLFLGVAGILTNLHFETQKRDRNLQNVAEAIARSPILTDTIQNNEKDSVALFNYLDSLKNALDDIDVISVVNQNNIRIYHSNHNLIGSIYDGTQPVFDVNSRGYYTVNETGPSGNQRRAYAVIYDENHQIIGFVMAIMLMTQIRSELWQTILIFSFITCLAIFVELFITVKLSGKVKKSLLGYEPDVFTAMYKMRDNILETLEEGILAVDKNNHIQYVNAAALHMLDLKPDIIGQTIVQIEDAILTNVIIYGDKEVNVRLENPDILLDRVSIKENEHIIGAIAILHNRSEYTKLMEDLSGTRYLVDSMRANNHDFTNKLHVILGLIQMKMYDEATSYIQNITIVQRSTISKIMNAISAPAIAALLIGKTARASELNIKFILREGCHYSESDLHLPTETLVTIIGNLLDNAFDAMNEETDYHTPKELLFGIFSHPDAVLITVDDTGIGIEKNHIKHIFENGYSTKGENRGTGLYQVKTMVESLGGQIIAESQTGVGTSFTISFKRKKKREN